VGKFNFKSQKLSHCLGGSDHLILFQLIMMNIVS